MELQDLGDRGYAADGVVLDFLERLVSLESKISAEAQKKWGKSTSDLAIKRFDV